jgi:hypothetical protein
MAAATLFVGQDYMVQRLPFMMVIVAATLLSVASWWGIDAVLALRRGRLLPLILVIVAALVIGQAARELTIRGLRVPRGAGLHLGIMAGIAVVAGAYARAALGRGRPGTQVVMLSALASWVAYLDLTILRSPFRDASLYLVAGATFARGGVPYITAPMTSVPADPSALPYLYPPFTLPFFAALSRLPHALGLAVIVGLCAAGVVLGLRLLGVKWRFLLILLAWPPLAIGVQVGNVACIGFLLLAATWRFGAAAPLSGVFKAQSGLISLWLVRERRWRPLLMGLGVIALLIVVTLPITGLSIYGTWLRSLGYFQQSFAYLPGTMGLALQRYFPAVVAAAAAIAVTVIGLLVSGREGLARLGIAAIAASPTVYIHGLAFGLPAVLMLDAAMFWALMILVPWWIGAWLMLAVTLAMLLAGLARRHLVNPAAVAGDAQPPPGGGPLGAERSLPFDSAVHPLGASLEPWPAAEPVVAPRPFQPSVAGPPSGVAGLDR